MIKVTFLNGSVKVYPEATRVIYPGAWVVLQKEKSTIFGLYIENIDIASFRQEDVTSTERIPVYGMRLVPITDEDL